MIITVFELLRFVKEGKAPKEIEYDNMNYVFRNYDYKEVHGELIDEQSSWLERIDFYKFDEPVGILLEDKKIEKVNTYVLCDSDFERMGVHSLKATEIIDKAFEEYSHKINEIIDRLEDK